MLILKDAEKIKKKAKKQYEKKLKKEKKKRKKIIKNIISNLIKQIKLESKKGAKYAYYFKTFHIIPTEEEEDKIKNFFVQKGYIIEIDKSRIDNIIIKIKWDDDK